MKTITINSIKFIASKKVFLINGKIWMNAMDLKFCMQNVGIATSTHFMMLVGSILHCEEFETTKKDETVTLNTGKEVTFKNPGIKRTSWELELGQRLMEKVFGANMVTMDFMGSEQPVQEVSSLDQIPEDVDTKA